MDKKSVCPKYDMRVLSRLQLAALKQFVYDCPKYA